MRVSKTRKLQAAHGTTIVHRMPVKLIAVLAAASVAVVVLLLANELMR